MLGSDVKLIDYSRKVDVANCITHASGAVAAAIGFAFMLAKANGVRSLLSAVIYCVSLIAVYSVSAVYHGLPAGEAKRIARLADHSTVPVLIAGTATPCALMTLWNISPAHCIFVMAAGWGCTLFGIFSKLFFFEKLKSVTVAVYIVSSVAMLVSVVPILDKINGGAFGGLLLGNAFYLTGAVFCAIGRKREVMHVVFHIFTLAASAVHWFVLYSYVI
jgi:hemolysin III